MRPNNGINLVKISLLLGCHWGRNPFSTVNFLLPMYTVYRELWMHLILELDMGAPAQYWEILAQQKQVVLGEKRWDRVHCPVHHFRNQTSRTFLKNIEQERLKRKKSKLQQRTTSSCLGNYQPPQQPEWKFHYGTTFPAHKRTPLPEKASYQTSQSILHLSLPPSPLLFFCSS